MKSNTLYIWVEGPTDSRFFNSVLKPLFSKKHQNVEIIEHAMKKKQYVKKFLKSIDSMNDEYIFVQDFDSKQCITSVKENLTSKYPNLNENKLEIVKDEIESWYAAGLTAEDSKYLKINYQNNTETITKEIFYNKIPKKFESRIDFTIEILKRYSIDQAIEKNNSFAHFHRKYF